MKLKNILPVIALGALLFQACDDNKMEWYNPHEGNGVASSELPLALAEQISRYDVIKSYIPRTDFVIGLGMGMDIYMADEKYRSIVDANFNSVTLGNAMKMDAIVNGKGETNFTKVDAFLQVLPQDIALYGHNLIWHTQQAATYLNNLIAPEIIIIPDDTDKMTNIIGNSDFETGAITGWGAWSSAGCKAEISSSGEGYNSNYAMKLTNPVAGANHSAQAYYTLPANYFKAGTTYVCTFYVKSMEGDDLFQIQLQNRTSYSGSHYLSQKLPTGQWTSFEAEFTADEKDLDMDHIVIDFGGSAGIYYIDDFKFGEKKEDPDAGRSSLLDNGSFTDGIDSWSKWNGPDGCNTWNETEGNKAKGCLQVINPSDNDGGEWKIQIHANLAQKIETGTQVYISYYIKTTEGVGSARISTTGKDHYQGNQSVTPDWQRIEWTFTAEGEIEGINFDLGLKAGTYLIDDVMVSLDPFNTETSPARHASTRGIEYVEKTDEEKTEIISNAMETWIKAMVGHYKDRVHSWDVLNEPIDDGGKLRGVEVMPNEGDMDSDDFYWGKYMGKDYAVKAFQWAREADPTAKLFINDYNLEYNPNKLTKLIEYVQYIDQNGAQVDGIGTQMHIAIDSDKDKIVEMFRTLANTNKLIRITELDIKVNTSSPTTANLAAQAEMYQFVIDKYKELIPETLQAGITIWTLSDHPDEHVYWIPDDAPNIFDANYARKHAYKGVCDGLAGKNVGAEFPGNLIIE